MKRFIIISTLIVLSTFNIILLAGPGSGGGGTGTGVSLCTAGGPGASTCEISYSVGGSGVTCSVTCNSPFYACCYLGWTLEPKCLCKSGSSNPS